MGSERNPHAEKRTRCPVEQPGMLVVAREFRGMTQADVAEAMVKASGGDAVVSQGYM